MFPTESTYVSSWERAMSPSDTFEQRIETTRKHFQLPLNRAYQELATNELGDGNLIFVGIGTGQIPLLMGVNSERVIGLDVNPNFLKVAAKRLPGADLHHGRLQDILPSLTPASTVIASEVLDCINPLELTDILHQIKAKSEKLIVVQTFTPDDEFYALSFHQEGFGSHGGPGIEGWSSEQLGLIIKMLTSHGIATEPQGWDQEIRKLQQLAEISIGGKLDFELQEIYGSSGFPLDEIPIATIAGRPYPAYFQGIAELLEINLSRFRNVAFPTTNESSMVSRYVKTHTAHRFSQLCVGTVEMEYHLHLLRQACKNAGYTDIRKGTIATSGSTLVPNSILVDHLNTALHTSQVKKRTSTHIRNISSGAFINGAPMTFFTPYENPFLDTRLQYVVAEY